MCVYTHACAIFARTMQHLVVTPSRLLRTCALPWARLIAKSFAAPMEKLRAVVMNSQACVKRGRSFGICVCEYANLLDVAYTSARRRYSVINVPNACRLPPLSPDLAHASGGIHVNIERARMYLECGVGLSWKSFHVEGQIIAYVMGSEFGSDLLVGGFFHFRGQNLC